MNEQTFLYKKIYLSHFIRKDWCCLCVRGELETETDCYILTQSSSDHSSTSSSFCWAAQPWVTEGPSPLSRAGSHSASMLSPTATAIRTLCLELTTTDQAVCDTWLYDCLTTTCFLWAYASAPNSTSSTGQGDIPISSTGCTCFRCSSAYLHRCISWLTAWSRVNML